MVDDDGEDGKQYPTCVLKPTGCLEDRLFCLSLGKRHHDHTFGGKTFCFLCLVPRI